MVCALPLGLFWGRRASSFMAIQLKSQAIAAALCSIVVRRPYIALVTSGGQLSEVRYILDQRTARVRRRLLQRAAFVVAQTSEVAQELAELLRPDQIAVIPNPVRAVHAWPLNGYRRAVYTGRLSAEKDLPRLLHAWRVIVDEFPDAELTLVGEGGSYRSVEDELRRTVAADDKLVRSVRFSGWVADVSSYLRAADLYVFPSLTEGMSNSLLEACAAQRVVVASDIPSNRAIVGSEYPLLFPAGNTDALVSAIRRAFEDDAVRVQALADLSRRLPEFSVDSVIARFEELIDAAHRTRH